MITKLIININFYAVEVIPYFDTNNLILKYIV